MDVLGYSERGVINSLIYEIDCLRKENSFIPEFLSLAMFEGEGCPSKIPPEFGPKFILVEQSFSQFGDADLLILGNANDQKISIFVEAKVKTFHSPEWHIRENEFEPFDKVLKGKMLKGVSSSNLFVQLYHKMQLMGGVRRCGRQRLIDEGIKCESWSSRKLRKILNKRKIHAIVEKAFDLLIDYKDNSYYLALVPGDRPEICRFLKSYGLVSRLPDWKSDKFGIIVWRDVEDLCKRSMPKLDKTLKVFDWNRCQGSC